MNAFCINDFEDHTIHRRKYVQETDFEVTEENVILFQKYFVKYRKTGRDVHYDFFSLN